MDEQKIIAAILATGLVMKQKTDLYGADHVVRLYRECLDELRNSEK